MSGRHVIRFADDRRCSGGHKTHPDRQRLFRVTGPPHPGRIVHWREALTMSGTPTGSRYGLSCTGEQAGIMSGFNAVSPTRFQAWWSVTCAVVRVQSGRQERAGKSCRSNKVERLPFGLCRSGNNVWVSSAQTRLLETRRKRLPVLG